ncbi:hypothetical protein C3Z10_21705 (plasmid) [Bacillus velezensis]|uniref:Uncharacterized protein n=1 Tax=Bacillus velezensis TaxID=492670 RepID=A0ABC8DFK4_BACVE|nr:hypothetical protein C3Z10_21705 [Bacillus velezensis]AWX74649.1 hypothetical protein BVDSYZ_21635 [Bacillus velezensis]
MRAPIAPVALDPTGLPETDALLLIQFFAAGAAIAEMQAPIAPVALDPTGLPETDGSFRYSSSLPVPPSPRDAGPDRLRCPGRLTGLPDLAALLLIQFFAVGAAIAEMQAPIAPVALMPDGSSGNRRAPSAAVLRCRCRHRPGMRAPIACVAPAA